MSIFEWDTDGPQRARFNRCRCCGMRKVLKPGDYCRDCAARTNDLASSERYIIVEPHTLDDTCNKTLVARSYLKAKMERAEEMGCQYVVFELFGRWHDVVIDEFFYLPRVMQTIFERNE